VKPLGNRKTPIRVEDAAGFPKELPHMPSSHVASYAHLVFSTKERQRLILPEWEPRLHSYMGGIVKGLDAVPLKIGGIEDHVHLLVSLKSKHRLDYFLRDLKADSSDWVHKEVTRLFEWQKGYGAFSVSPGAIEAVGRYIENQKQHHRRIDFKTEYVDLLRRADVDFEERFLW
jgi:REP element-mobilizing transposase RayT